MGGYALFVRSVDWNKALSLKRGSAKDNILRDLLFANGRYVHGWSAWRGDWRKRVSELRAPVEKGGFGLPIVDRPCEGRPGQNEYALPKWFCTIFWEYTKQGTT